MSVRVKDVLTIAHTDVQNMSSLRRRSFANVSTDSRRIVQGDLFIALRGEKLDGHCFVQSAFDKGAICAIVDEHSDHAPFKNHPHVVVQDTTRALAELARVHRKKFSIPVLAIAGSNGKTTTKEMTAKILSTRYRVLSTEGNLNNHIGVPMTLFRLTERHEVVVLELGTNHPGEIMNLCRIAQPTHGMLTNIGNEHLEFFKDLEGVADAEGELFSALGKRGTGFINKDDNRIVFQSNGVTKKVTYGFSGSVAVRGTLQAIGTDGCALFSIHPRGKRAFDIELGVPGKHSMHNALAAVAAGLAFRVPVKNIQRELRKFRPVGKRMEVIKSHGIAIINDTYNANSDSVLSALETLRDMHTKGSKIVILADMLELGAMAQREHERIGSAVKSMGFNILLTFGPMARHINTAANGIDTNLHYEEKNALAEYAAELMTRDDIVLVKGSRGMAMEDIVTFFQERLENRSI